MAKKEKTAEYYSEIYKDGYDVSRYQYLYNAVRDLLISYPHCGGKVLDAGCGTQGLKKALPSSIDYDGFDFADIPGVRKGDLYSDDISNYDTYVFLEVLEHVDDLKVLSRVPVGKRVVFSVPTFDDPAHLRTYNLNTIESRFGVLLDIQSVKAFRFADNAHLPNDGFLLKSSMFLISGVRKSFTLGASMIVRNEANHLADCLDTLKGIDEIVILDTGSEDKTAEVAKKYNCTYVAGKYKWNDDFAEARNEALKHGKSDYVLIIDADEKLMCPVQRVKDAIVQYDALTYRVNTVAASCGQTHISIRVHKRCPEVFWKAPVHNYLSVSGGPFLAGIEIHYGWSDAHKRDPERAMRILKKWIAAHPDASRERYYLALEYFQREQYKEALDILTEYFKFGFAAPEVADAYLFAARCSYMLKDLDGAWGHACHALMVNPDFAEVYRFFAAIARPENKEYWLRNARVATNNNVLFVRE